jgi:outer membrane protein OmpA-like peptidoglycan-associated protein
VIPILAGTPALLCEINGYTDSLGDAQFNRTLSEERATATKDYLVSHGIAADRLTAAGFGDSHPIASNETAEGRRKNRRIEFVLREK